MPRNLLVCLRLVPENKHVHEKEGRHDDGETHMYDGIRTDHTPNRQCVALQLRLLLGWFGRTAGGLMGGSKSLFC